MKSRGFTLIELMVTIAILAIIMAVAVPAYQNQVEKARRADAVSSLMETAQQLERCFTRTNSYAGCISFPEPSQDGFYTIDATTTSTSYDLTATATGGHSDSCSPFELDHLGNKTDAGGSSDKCWGN